jgi:hypothetical protein
MTPPAAVQVHSAQQAAPARAIEVRSSAPVRRANGPRLALIVASIGYLVPRTGFSGRVHSVFARACNFACDDGLLTVHAAGDGPATLRLARGTPLDLRNHLEVGEGVDCHDGSARTSGVELWLRHASVWRPGAPGPRLPPARIDANLRNAKTTLARRRAMQRNVLDGEAAASAAALGDSCRAFDGERAARHAGSLIGWGEGLTPAGDDFLVGLIAGLEALVGGDERRRRLHAGLVAAIVTGAARTTPIAAHCLRLAVGGHCNETLLRLRDALLCEADEVIVDAALCNALDVGATSGADTVSGLLAGLLAWSPASCSIETA